MDSQVGPELPEPNPFSDYFASHVMDVTDQLEITSNTITYVNEYQFYDDNWNWGWHSFYLLVLFESPDIDDPTCVRIYTADEEQWIPQEYTVSTPSFESDTPVGLAMYSDRLSGFASDSSIVELNNDTLGVLGGTEEGSSSGVRGFYYYRDKNLFGLGDDTADDEMGGLDALANISNLLTPEPGSDNSLTIYRIEQNDENGANPFPAFFLTYTPSCPVVDEGLPARVTVCRGDTVELQPEGFDHYAWYPAPGIADTTAAYQQFVPDSSDWYRVKMWDEESGENPACSKTIPVWVHVQPYPVHEVTVTPTTCPDSTGQISLVPVADTSNYTYSLNGGPFTAEPNFDGLAHGLHYITAKDSLGCTWSTVDTVPLNPPVNAGFTPLPSRGESPLDVRFVNQSSTSSIEHLWLIDGQQVGSSNGFNYTFQDSGTFSVELVSYLQEPWCSDTASALIRVEPGLKITVPNIITPNNDGRNDKLVAQLYGVNSIRWTIRNRWGKEIKSGEASFPGESLELWDGKAPNDQKAPSGTYFVEIVLEGYDGRVEKMMAEVLLGGR